jgi:hypothetical protein
MPLADAKLDAQMPNSMLSHTSIWRKRQVGVNSSEKASSLMRTYKLFPFLILIAGFVILEA